LRVMVEEGAQVEEGQTIAVLESMKMEFPAVAGCAGTVQALHCAPGATAQAGQVLAVVEKQNDEKMK